MSTIKPPPMDDATTLPLRKKSGEHAAVKAMREKFDSIAEHTVPMTEALVSRVDELGKTVSSHPPPEEVCTCEDSSQPCPLHPKEPSP